jgi:hypothetical protein
MIDEFEEIPAEKVVDDLGKMSDRNFEGLGQFGESDVGAAIIVGLLHHLLFLLLVSDLVWAAEHFASRCCT